MCAWWKETPLIGEQPGSSPSSTTKDVYDLVKSLNSLNLQLFLVVVYSFLKCVYH